MTNIIPCQDQDVAFPFDGPFSLELLMRFFAEVIIVRVKLKRSIQRTKREKSKSDSVRFLSTASCASIEMEELRLAKIR